MKSEFYAGYQIRDGYKYTCCQFCQKEWQVCAQRTGWYVCPWCEFKYRKENENDIERKSRRG
nr:MAG TPA: DNA-directed RNA polymerase [Caudoviricetes sp.]